MRRPLALAMTLLMSGCASFSSSISPSYVSPVQYQSYSCEQLAQEMTRVRGKVSDVSGDQDSEATKDAVVLGVGLVAFWPALFLLAVGNDQEDELARLKGEVAALEQMTVQQGCISKLAPVEQEVEIDEQRAAEPTAQ